MTMLFEKGIYTLRLLQFNRQASMEEERRTSVSVLTFRGILSICLQMQYDQMVFGGFNCILSIFRVYERTYFATHSVYWVWCVWGVVFGVWGLVFWSVGCGVWGLACGVWRVRFGVRGFVFWVVGSCVWSHSPELEVCGSPLPDISGGTWPTRRWTEIQHCWSHSHLSPNHHAQPAVKFQTSFCWGCGLRSSSLSNLNIHCDSRIFPGSHVGLPSSTSTTGHGWQPSSLLLTAVGSDLGCEVLGLECVNFGVLYLGLCDLIFDLEFISSFVVLDD